MFTIDEQRQRVKELSTLAEQTAGQHNMIVGRLNEAKEILAFMEAKAAEKPAAAKKAPTTKAKSEKKPVKVELKEVKKAIANS